MTVRHLYNDISNQQDAAKSVFFLLILLSLIYMFLATVSPIFRSTLSVYTSFWNNVPTLLSAADRSAKDSKASLKESIKTNFAASCWLLISKKAKINFNELPYLL